MLQHTSIQLLFESSFCKSVNVAFPEPSVISFTYLLRNVCSVLNICWLLIFALGNFYWSFVMSDNDWNETSCWVLYGTLWFFLKQFHRIGCLTSSSNHGKVFTGGGGGCVLGTLRYNYVHIPADQASESSHPWETFTAAAHCRTNLCKSAKQEKKASQSSKIQPVTIQGR